MKINILTSKKAQTSIEYMLLLAAVVAVVLIGFKKYMPDVHGYMQIFYNRAARGILDKPNPCGDGVCGSFEDYKNCSVDCSAPP